MTIQADTLGVGIHPHRVFVYQVSTEHTGHCNENGGKNRQGYAPRLKPFAGVAIAHQPVERSDGEQHHRNYGVAPASNQPPHAGYQRQVYQSGETGQPPAKRADPHQPQAGARPKRVVGKNKRDVAADHKQQGGEGQVDQYRVKRVSGDRHTTEDRLLCHQLLPYKTLKDEKSTARNSAGWLLILVCIFCAGCDGSQPQSTLNPAGPSALIISWLWWGMFSFFTLVLLVVVALWIYAMRRQSDVPDLARAKRVNARWIIGGGVILPLTTVIVLLVVGIPAGQRVLSLPASEQTPLVVEVVGHRWWWEIRYPDADVVIANQLYLPVDQPVDFYVTTEDVIHAFWVPRLGGKIDLIPGRTNHLRLQAFDTGTMRGQCAEFCGAGHAHMVLDVEVLEVADFEAWLQRRQQPVEVPAVHKDAARAFTDHCGHCHTVTGVSSGASAPDLTDVGARRLLGSGIRQGEHPTIERWLNTHPTFIKGGSTPDHRLLAEDEHSKIAAWLETLGND